MAARRVDTPPCGGSVVGGDVAEREGALDAARGRIADLEAEVARLRARVADAGAVEELRARLAGVGVAATLDAPDEHDDPLEQLVLAAMAILRASAGTLYLVDEDADELIFAVALGERATALRGRRMPIGHGLAGWVARTGQALAVADARQDRRWAREVAGAGDERPHPILVVPLLRRDEVIGVLQLLDKEGDAAFTAADLETLGRLAPLAAAAVAESARARNLAALLRDQLAEFGGLGGVAARLEASAEYREVAEIAAVVGGLVRRGEAARRLCRELVGALETYLRASAPYRQDD